MRDAALVRHLLKKTPIPYTVILICIGLVVGAVSNVVEPIHTYTSVARMDPHLLLFVFLPVLIFESAFAMDVHTFKKTVGQSLILAGPGMVVSAVLTSVMAHYIFNYQWSWTVCLLFGTILSATDPVAVVALLKGLGMSLPVFVVVWEVVVGGRVMFACVMRVSGLEGVVCARTSHEHLVIQHIAIAVACCCCKYKDMVGFKPSLLCCRCSRSVRDCD